MDTNNLPTHIAIIMDGNRRWAREHGLEVKDGHKEGAKTLEKVVRHARDIGIKYVTVYAFSTENWKRTKEEVGALMALLQNYIDEYSKRADAENTRIKVLGDITALNEGMQKAIINCQEKTKDNTEETEQATQRVSFGKHNHGTSSRSSCSALFASANDRTKRRTRERWSEESWPNIPTSSALSRSTAAI